MNRPSNHRLIALLAPVLLGSVLILYATEIYGVGVSRDSVGYLNAARNVAETGAFVTDVTPGPGQPLTHWPVLYPAALSVLYEFTADPVFSARWLNMLLFGLYILGIEVLVLRETGGSVMAGVIAGLFAALSYDLLYIFARAWSETLFLSLLVWGMLFLGVYLSDRRSVPLMVGAALFGLAWLARYVGVTLLVTGVLAIVMWGRQDYRRRIGDTFLFAVVVATPMSVLMLRNYLLTDNIANRTVAVHPVSLRWWSNGIDVVGGWIAPLSAPAAATWVAAVMLVAGTAGGAYFVVKVRRSEASQAFAERAWVYPATHLLFIGIYLATFWAVVSFADTGSLSGRSLAPVQTAVLVVTAYAVYLFLASDSRAGAWSSAAIVVLVALLIFQTWRGVSWAASARETGLSYSAAAYRESSVVIRLRDKPPTHFAYSNNPQLLYFLTERKSFSLFDISCQTSCDQLARVLQQARERSDNGIEIVWASGHDASDCGPCLDSLSSALGLELTDSDGLFSVYVTEAPP